MAGPSYRRVALVNPRWEFEGSRYWSCRETHLPLELLYAEALLTEVGVSAMVVDAHLEDLSPQQTAARLCSFQPDLIVVTTAPTYLFWRCPQPELDIPIAVCDASKGIAPIVAVGPHGSATPGYVLDRLGCQGVIRGEPEQELVRLALHGDAPSVAWASEEVGRGSAVPAAVDLRQLPALAYRTYPLERRVHRHHVFWGEGRGAEVEYSRGCPYGCSFCNRRFFRGRYRERPLERVLAELRRLRSRGIDYVYFIDELFGLGRCEALLRALAEEPIVRFGCETRIDLWDEDRLDLLAAAGCVSVEFGIESPFPDIQSAVNKGYRIDGERILDLMAHAKTMIPWVQGDMLELPGSSPELRERTERWRQEAIGRGVWVSDPISVFPYPGCDLHDELLGPIDDRSWIRAQERFGQCAS